LEKGKHVGGGLVEIFIGGDFGERDGVWEPVHGECITDSKSAGDVAFVAAVMFSGRTDVPAVNSVWRHVVTLVGRDMDDDTSSRRGKRTAVKVEYTVDASIGRELGLSTWRAEKVKGNISLWHEEIPFGEGEFWVTCSQARAKMVFPGLDGSFGGVAAVAVRRDTLEVDVVFFKSLLELVRAFVIEDVEVGCISVGLEPGVEGCPGIGELTCLTSF
jgi:hypothetical protein